MKLLSKILIVSIFCAALIYHAVAIEKPQVESWLESRRALTGGDVDVDNEVASSLVHEVKLSRSFQAEQLLEAKSFVSLSDKQVTSLFGIEEKDRTPNKPYLVRGVYLNGNGEFRLFFKDGVLIVTHGSLGAGGKAFRCPLLVFLPSPPKIVHTYASPSN